MLSSARWAPWKVTCAGLTRMVLILALAFVSVSAGAIDISNRYRSRRNPDRKPRLSTDYIILHTTEAPAKGSLNKVSEYGECHYCVTEDGTVYAIVDRDREAFHAGRSMWNGKTDMDKYSIGIECVGYHDKSMPLVQLHAIRDLVKELKKLYNLTDDRVMTHSMVAYGEPNRWQKKRHRGRKRCGMLFAMPSVRRILELNAKVKTDPDTKAKRLAIGDPYLQRVLYGGVDTMRATYADVPAASPKPAVAKVRDPALGVASKPKPPPSSPPHRTLAAPLPIPTSIADLKAQGYAIKGAVAKGRTASQIAGARWNAANTYYTIRNKVFPGNIINPAHIEVGMQIWMK